MTDPMTILSEDEVKRIHGASLDILEQTGVKVHSDEAIDLLSKAGSDANIKDKTVKIPRTLVEEMISKGRRCKALFSRDPGYMLELGRGNTYMMTGSTAIQVVDIETGKVRPSRRRDIEESARVADALENVHIYCGMAEALDYPCDLSALKQQSRTQPSMWQLDCKAAEKPDS
jgi:trimethylamine--corrinoid protein Co-methyltransferase